METLFGVLGFLILTRGLWFIHVALVTHMQCAFLSHKLMFVATNLNLSLRMTPLNQILDYSWLRMTFFFSQFSALNLPVCGRRVVFEELSIDFACFALPSLHLQIVFTRLMWYNTLIITLILLLCRSILCAKVWILQQQN